MIRVIGSKLYIGDYAAEEIALRYGTPVYVYDLETVIENYNRLINSIPYDRVEILYSCKANNNIKILETLRDLGSGLDVVSPFEALLGVKLGFPRDKILFTGNNVSDEEMRFVRDLGILINIDSLSQLKRYGRMFPNTEVSIRINPGLGAGHHSYTMTGGLTKFGLYIDQIDRVLEYSKHYNLKIIGLHTHIGSGILDIEPYREALKIVLRIAEKLRDLEFIDIGGGLGIPYKPDEKPLDLALFGRTVVELVREFNKKYQQTVKLRVEPGRYIVGDAGVLLVRVVDIKEVESGGKRKIFVGVDSGMNHLIRPALYGAYHEIIAVNKADHERTQIVDVVGNICESGDIIAIERSMPALEEGDILAIMNVGAYGYSMSSNYNLRPRPPEVVVYKREIELTRRRETFEDLMKTFLDLRLD
ncbi:MAG: diaminopimelate decarboxylase [Sulfolobales archaeon]